MRQMIVKAFSSLVPMDMLTNCKGLDSLGHILGQLLHVVCDRERQPSCVRV